jgi:hypothetical protein
MILAKTASNWLKQYLQENGGQMTIALETMVLN